MKPKRKKRHSHKWFYVGTRGRTARVFFFPVGEESWLEYECDCGEIKMKGHSRWGSI